MTLAKRTADGAFLQPDMLRYYGPVTTGRGVTTTQRAENTATLNLAAASGKSVQLPHEPIEVSGQISLTAPGTVIWGSRNSRIYDMRPPGVLNTFRFLADYCELRGFAMDGGLANAYQVGHRGIYGNRTIYSPTHIITYLRGCRVIDVEIVNYGADGIRLDYSQSGRFFDNQVSFCASHGIMLGAGSGGNEIDRNRVTDIVPGDTTGGIAPYHPAYGISVTRDPARDTTDAPISVNNRISNNFVARVRSWNGIDSHGAQDIQIVNNTVEHCSIGVHLEDGNKTTSPTQDVPTRELVITGNKITGNLGTGFGVGPGINVDGSGTASDVNSFLNSITISGNLLRYCGSTAGLYAAGAKGAVHVYGARGVTVNGNAFEDSLGVGVWLDNADAVQILGNAFRNVRVSGARRTGVWVADGDVTFTADLNTFVGDTGMIGIEAASAVDGTHEYKIGTNNQKVGSMLLLGSNLPTPG